MGLVFKIKNMEMPNTCGECRFSEFDWEWDTCQCTLLKKGIEVDERTEWIKSERLEDCPLEEVDDYE